MTDRAGEEAFEREIAEYLAAHDWLYSPTAAGYDRDRALFPEDVFGWLESTQPTELAKVVTRGGTSEAKERARLLDALVKCLDAPMTSGGGTLNVLRRGFSHVSAKLDMCQFRPESTRNRDLLAKYQAVRLRVMRQVTYAPTTAGDAPPSGRIDMVFFVNGIPVATVELKSFFKQEWRSAIRQYCEDRDPKGQPLLRFGRALVHFAVDDDEVWMTTRLAGAKTHFLPFNQGTKDAGKGNPLNQAGAATSYLWERVWQRDSWLNILGALMFLRTESERDQITGRTKKKTDLIFPRFHQWQAVAQLTGAVTADGPGKRYLVQHSAGSGKTNTIAWTAHRLARLHDESDRKVFDKVLVVSDRRVLDRQLQDAVRQVDNTASLVTTIDATQVRQAGGSKSSALAAALTGNSLIVIVTIQTFPFVAEQMSGDLSNRNFAVIVDEAHTSQSGATAAELKRILAEGGIEIPDGEEISAEDVMNARIAAKQDAKANHRNVSYLAFTATPKPETLTVFDRPGPSGEPPFHTYTMHQAIEEGFILDVLRGYQTYKTAYQIEVRAARGVRSGISDGHEVVARPVDEDDGVGQPGDLVVDSRLVDSKAAARGIMKWAALHEANIGQKVEIIVEHFRANVAHLLDGHAKAMVVTGSRVAAVRYKREIDEYIRRKGYSLGTIVAFSGKVTDKDYGIKDATEHSLNQDAAGKSLGSDLAAEFRRAEFRVMLVADKFQTGFDQPLLCAMYVDKQLPGVHAVQTLSRLNRTYRIPGGPVKDTTFVLDFVNDPADILAAFRPYYRQAHIEGETDPNIVHGLAAKLAESDIYLREEVEQFARAWFAADDATASQARLRAALSAAVKPAKDRFTDRYTAALDDADRAELSELDGFRRDAETFVRMYDFMSQVINYGDTDLEKLCTYLRQLVRVIATHRSTDEVDLSGLVMKRVKQIDRGKANLKLGTGDADTALPAITAGGSGAARQEPELERLSDVVARINELFGGELSAEDIEGFVKPVAAKAEAAPGISEQIDNNAKDQFLDSRNLTQSILDAIFQADAVRGKLAGAAMADDDRAALLVKVIGEYMWETRRERRDQEEGPRNEQYQGKHRRD